MKCFEKKKFSRKGAWEALHRISVTKPAGQFACTMYACQSCGRYHLSKMPPATDLAAEWRRMAAAGIV